MVVMGIHYPGCNNIVFFHAYNLVTDEIEDMNAKISEFMKEEGYTLVPQEIFPHSIKYEKDNECYVLWELTKFDPEKAKQFYQIEQECLKQAALNKLEGVNNA